jgi:hypothetical protein
VKHPVEGIHAQTKSMDGGTLRSKR